MRLALLIWFLLLLLPAWAAEQPYRIGYHGRLVTDVYIDGKGPFAFLIDTASSRTLMFEHVRKALGLAQSQSRLLTVYGLNDVSQALPVRPGALAVAGENLSGLTLGVLPDDADSPDGVLGTDVLARYFVVLDRAGMRLRLLPPGSDSDREFITWSRAPLTARPLKNFDIRFWYLDARFNDRGIPALLDLGAAMTMLNWQAAERLGVRQQSYAAFGPPPAILQDVLGKKAPAVKLYGLDVALRGRAWKNQFAMVADAPVFDYFDLEEKPAAIVGLDLLGDNSLAIDFQGGNLFVGPRAPEKGS